MSDQGPLNDATAFATLTNYRLLLGSPMIGAGVDLVTTYGLTAVPFDFFGHAVPSGVPPDVGAAQF